MAELRKAPVPRGELKGMEELLLGAKELGGGGSAAAFCIQQAKAAKAKSEWPKASKIIKWIWVLPFHDTQADTITFVENQFPS